MEQTMRDARHSPRARPAQRSGAPNRRPSIPCPLFSCVVPERLTPGDPVRLIHSARHTQPQRHRASAARPRPLALVPQLEGWAAHPARWGVGARGGATPPGRSRSTEAIPLAPNPPCAFPPPLPLACPEHRACHVQGSFACMAWHARCGAHGRATSGNAFGMRARLSGSERITRGCRGQWHGTLGMRSPHMVFGGPVGCCGVGQQPGRGAPLRLLWSWDVAGKVSGGNRRRAHAGIPCLPLAHQGSCRRARIIC